MHASADGPAGGGTAGDWGSPVGPEPAEPALVIDVDGYEGPLDLLLALARSQKVDLARISILALAEQYLSFVERARELRLELAADYLVMAAWLAYLKSRLLIPEAPADDDEPTGEMLAAMLAFRLRRLEAMRAAAGRLMERDRLGVTVFARGAPEPVAVVARPQFEASLFDLIAAYADQRQRRIEARVHVARRTVWSLAEAREILERLVGRAADWMPVESFLAPWLTPATRATVRASTFSAALEMVREGRLELRQASAFSPLYLRAAPPGDGEGDA